MILWHGRMIYTTSARMCFFVMHRGLIIAMIQLYYSTIFYFIDTQVFSGYLMLGYSTIYTALPVISIVARA